MNELKYKIYNLDEDNELADPTDRVIEAEKLEDAYRIFKKKEGTELEDNPLALVPLCPKCEGALVNLEFTEWMNLEVDQFGTYIQQSTKGIYRCPVCKENIGWTGDCTGDPSIDRAGFTPNIE